MVNLERIELFYARHYKKLLVIPILLFLIAFGFVLQFYFTTGEFFHRDVSLRGGITATVSTNQDVDIPALQNSLGAEATVRRLTDFSGRQIGIIIEVSDLDQETLKTRLSTFFNIALTQNNYSVEETGPRLGESFYRQLLIALAFSFILMSLSVAFTFKTFVPSIAVIGATLMDIIVSLAILNAFGFTISSAGLVAFLLVIGYSVDNNILLTNWMLRKREHTLFKRMWHSMQTGMTMTVAALVVMIIGIFFSNSPTIREIFIIIFLNLIIDLFSTYFTNTSILWWYAKRKGIQ